MPHLTVDDRAHMEGRTDGSTSGRHTKDDSRLESRTAVRSPWDVVPERTAVIHMRYVVCRAIVSRRTHSA